MSWYLLLVTKRFTNSLISVITELLCKLNLQTKESLIKYLKSLKSLSSMDPFKLGALLTGHLLSSLKMTPNKYVPIAMAISSKLKGLQVRIFVTDFIFKITYRVVAGSALPCWSRIFTSLLDMMSSPEQLFSIYVLFRAFFLLLAIHPEFKCSGISNREFV